MSAKTETASGGIGFFGLLGIVFIVMKLTGYIDWSWWWVLAPLWLPACVVFGVMAVIFCIVLAVKAISK